MTACQIGPKPLAAVFTSTSQALFRSAALISTSRLPELTTPTSCAACGCLRWPFSNRNNRVSIAILHHPCPHAQVRKCGRPKKYSSQYLQIANVCEAIKGRLLKLHGSILKRYFCAALTAYQFRKRFGGWYKPPDARTRSFMLLAASRSRVASRLSMP